MNSTKSVRSRLIVTKVVSHGFKSESARRIFLEHTRLTSNVGVVYLPRQEANGGEELNQRLGVPVTNETATGFDRSRFENQPSSEPYATLTCGWPTHSFTPTLLYPMKVHMLTPLLWTFLTC